jgi:glucokinase
MGPENTTMMPDLAFPVLIGDIGGTYSRFSVLSHPDARVQAICRVETRAFPGPEAAIAHVLRSSTGGPARSALLGIAGRVGSGTLRLTNASWLLDPEEIGRAAGFRGVSILNDYLPVAAALDSLGEGGRVQIGKGPAAGDGLALACGPGTGFGAAVARPVGDVVVLEPTEAGHIEFGPCEPDEFALWPRLERALGRTTAESVLSGPGLVRLYNAMSLESRSDAAAATAADVTRAAAAGEPIAIRAVDRWARLLGRFVGDLALLFGATGGVFLSGGIAPRLIEVLERAGFRDAFERKAPFGDLMASIPTFVIVEPEPALLGLGLIASSPQCFAFDGRHWRL